MDLSDHFDFLIDNQLSSDHSGHFGTNILINEAHILLCIFYLRHVLFSLSQSGSTILFSRLSLCCYWVVYPCVVVGSFIPVFLFGPLSLCSCLVIFSYVPVWSFIPVFLFGRLSLYSCLVVYLCIPVWSFIPVFLFGRLSLYSCLVVYPCIPVWLFIPVLLLGQLSLCSCLVVYPVFLFGCLSLCCCWIDYPCVPVWLFISVFLLGNLSLYSCLVIYPCWSLVVYPCVDVFKLAFYWLGVFAFFGMFFVVQQVFYSMAGSKKWWHNVSVHNLVSEWTQNKDCRQVGVFKHEDVRPFDRRSKVYLSPYAVKHLQSVLCFTYRHMTDITADSITNLIIIVSLCCLLSMFCHAITEWSTLELFATFW